ncbi:MAG TPA: ester cyclase [Actinomycetota bacterium]|nr:ester cyclase [Actinomycetota bacterium]
MDVARGYIEAWNTRDPEQILAVFTEGGTYEDPTSGGPISGPGIVGYVTGLLTMLPDLSFDIVDVGAVSGSAKVTLQWVMRGTNSGPLPAGPPLGRTIAVPGVDIITVSGDKVASVQGYFDMQTTYQQLGLKAEPMPADAIGPFTFGTAAYAQMGNLTKPGALSFTAIDVRNDADRQDVFQRSQLISMELLGLPGFIGFLGITTPDRMFTVTAWDDADAPARLRSQGTHSEAVRAFFNGDVGGTVTLTVWARSGSSSTSAARSAARSPNPAGARAPMATPCLRSGTSEIPGCRGRALTRSGSTHAAPPPNSGTFVPANGTNVPRMMRAAIRVRP